MTTDSEYEAVSAVLTLPSIREPVEDKPIVFLPHDCSERYYKSFTKQFPQIDFKKSENSDNLHSAAACIRSIFRVQIERDMRRHATDSYLEIGATVSGFISSTREVHCCLPSIVDMDVGRMLDQLHQIRQKCEKNLELRNELSEKCSERIQQLNRFIKTSETTDFVCGDRFEDCNHKCPVAVASYVCPDISVEDFVKGMLRHGCHTAYVSMMDAPCIMLGGTTDRNDFTEVIATLDSIGAVTDENVVLIGGVSAQQDHRRFLKRCWDSLLLKDDAEKLLTAQLQQDEYRSLPVDDARVLKCISGSVKRFFNMKTKGDYDPFVKETYRDFTDEIISFSLPGGRVHKHSMRLMNEWLHMADVTPVKVNGSHYALKSEIIAAVESQILFRLTLTKVKQPVQMQKTTLGRVQLYDNAYVCTKTFERTLVGERLRVKVTPCPDQMFQTMMSTMQGFSSVSFTKAIKLIVSNASRVVFSANTLKEGSKMTALDIYYISIGLMEVAAQRADDIFKNCPCGFLKNSIVYSCDQRIVKKKSCTYAYY